MVMKSVGIAELKARLSAYLKDVEAGESITVLDRRRPIARIVPAGSRATGLVLRPRHGALHDEPLPPPLGLTTDAVAILLEDRQGER
jgi:prevent-host-death family protein